MSSPVVWNPFTNNLDYVGTSATPPPSAVTSVTVTNGLQQNQTTGNVIVSGIDASTTQRGVAKFDDNFFDVHSGLVTLKGYKVGSGTTIGEVTSDIVTIPLDSVSKAYSFTADVVGITSDGSSSCQYAVFGAIRTDGATATLVGNDDQDIFNEDPALATAVAYFTVSGNNAILQVLGVTALTIKWGASVKQINVIN